MKRINDPRRTTGAYTYIDLFREKLSKQELDEAARVYTLPDSTKDSTEFLPVCPLPTGHPLSNYIYNGNEQQILGALHDQDQDAHPHPLKKLDGFSLLIEKEKASNRFTKAHTKIEQLIKVPLKYKDKDKQGLQCLHDYRTATHALMLLLLNNKIRNEYTYYNQLTNHTLNNANAQFPHYPPNAFKLHSDAPQSLIGAINLYDIEHNVEKNNSNYIYSGEDLLTTALNMPEDNDLHLSNTVDHTKPNSSYISQPGIRIDSNQLTAKTKKYFHNLNDAIRNGQYAPHDAEVFNEIRNISPSHFTSHETKELIVKTYATLLYLFHFKKYKKGANLALLLLEQCLLIRKRVRHNKNNPDRQLINDDLKHWIINSETPAWITEVLYYAHPALTKRLLEKNSHETIGIAQFLSHAHEAAILSIKIGEKFSGPAFHEFLDKACPGWRDQSTDNQTQTDIQPDTQIIVID